MDEVATLAGAPLALTRLGVLMEPDENRPTERCGVLNPGAARDPTGRLVLFPRAVASGNYSRIGRAYVLCNADGIPTGAERLGYALEPWEPCERGPAENTGGCEDARITYLEPLQRYVMCYVARGPRGSRVALAVSRDLLSWQRLGRVRFGSDPAYGVDFDTYRDKDAAYFPRAVTAPDGQEALALLHRPLYDDHERPHGLADPRPGIWISYCPLTACRRDLRALTRPAQHHLLALPQLPWEDAWIGGGAPPILTASGWLVLYHGVRKREPRYDGEKKPVTYSAGALLLDERDPRRVLGRAPAPILTPSTPAEREGVSPDAVFPTGIDPRGSGCLDLYYGMADTRIGVARLRLPEALALRQW